MAITTSSIFTSDLSPQTKQTISILLLVIGFLASFVWDQRINLLCGMVSLSALTLAVCLALPQQLSIHMMRGQSRSTKALVGVMGALFVWTWVRAFTSDVPATSIMAAGYYTIPLLVAAWVAMQTRLDTVLRAAFLCLGILAALAVVGVFLAAYGDVTGDYIRKTYRIDWPMQDANHYAMLMNVGVIAGLGMMAHPKTRSLGIGIAALAWIGDLLAGSRAGTIALVIALAVLALPFLKTFRANPRPLVHILGGGLILLLAVMVLRPSGTTLVTNMPGLVNNIHQSSGNRPMMWGNTARLVADRPIFGYGTGTFIHVYPKTMTAANYDSGYAAHNDWLQIWLELGGIGAGLYAALGLVIVWMCVATRRIIIPEEIKVMRMTAVAVMTALALHAQIEFMLMVVPVLILFGFALGLFLQTHWVPVDVRNTQGRRRPVLVIGLVVILLSTLSVMQTQAQISADQSNAAINRGDLRTFARKLEQTSYYSIDLHAYPYLRTAHYQLAVLMNGGNGVRTTPADVQAAIDAALARNAYSSTTYDVQGRLDQYLGKSPEDAWVRAMMLEPRNADVRLSLLRLYERQGNTQKLNQLVQSSVGWSHMRGQHALLKQALRPYEKSQK